MRPVRGHAVSGQCCGRRAPSPQTRSHAGARRARACRPGCMAGLSRYHCFDIDFFCIQLDFGTGRSGAGPMTGKTAAGGRRMPCPAPVLPRFCPGFAPVGPMSGQCRANVPTAAPSLTGAARAARGSCRTSGIRRQPPVSAAFAGPYRPGRIGHASAAHLPRIGHAPRTPARPHRPQPDTPCSTTRAIRAPPEFPAPPHRPASRPALRPAL